MAAVEPTVIVRGGERGDDVWRWVGPDDRGIELEVVALALPDVLLVIHVMPTRFRGARR